MALLALAEAYPRIPDRATAARLLAERLRADWRAAPASSSASVTAASVNAASVALQFARTVIVGGGGRPRMGLAMLARPAVNALLGLLAKHYICGRTIEQALRRTRGGRGTRGTRGREDSGAVGGAVAAAAPAFRYSFDMLGEAALTSDDVARYLDSYHRVISALAASADRAGSARGNDGVSIKLSALDCRYESLQRAQAVPRLIHIVTTLARAARAGNIELTIDAEEADRLEMSLEVIEAVAADPDLSGWDGLGFAVQAYQRSALKVIEWAERLACRTGLTLGVRLVKGAYWDAEVKRAQELGLAAYPVYTRKLVTDVNYLACARALLDCAHLYPAFATHNPQTAATIRVWCAQRRDWEFQRLYGMGAGLYEPAVLDEGLRCRVYAPVGDYAQLLPYLIRRIFENGANAGFMHRLAVGDVDDDALLADPAAALRATPWTESEVIVMPQQLFPDRPNSAGIDLSDREQTRTLLQHMAMSWATAQHAAPIIGGREVSGPSCEVHDPADAQRVVGTVVQALPTHVAEAFERAARAQPGWAGEDVEVRAACLARMADLLEAQRDALMALMIREGGKSILDALAEVREAVDFCRYYAVQGREWMAPVALPGPTGEHNELRWEARGTFGCISPWNFPLSIFIGQISAALVTGNAVIAKPAPQTPLIAAAAVRLLLQAGIPPDVIAFLPGADDIGAAITADPRIAGVAFTGSISTAKRIARALLGDEAAGAARPLVPLLAETGGLNAMVVDSSALAQRVVADVVTSAFRSTGQRCSALRLLCLQQDIASSTLELLIGAMRELRVGDPADPATDVGPVIDADARRSIEDYLAGLSPGQILYRAPLPAQLTAGCFVAPTLVRLQTVEELRCEVFGPVLHVVTWRAGELERLIDRINASGYGLTMGLQSRLAERIEQVRRRAKVGNLYVNRSIIGAVVGSQPFGGERLSGTGPKAGGPHYLTRFMTERTLTINTAAIGADVELARKAT